MTPIAALEVLDKATESMSGNRAAHAQVCLAVETLKVFIHQKSGNVQAVAPPPVKTGGGKKPKENSKASLEPPPPPAPA